MMTRPLIVALLGTLIANAPDVQADRSKKKRAQVTQEDEGDDEVESPKVTSKKKLAGRDKAEKAEKAERAEKAEKAEKAERKAAASSKKRVAVTDDDDGDGPEARSAVAVDLDDLIDSAIRQAPDLARAKVAKLEAKGQAKASRRDMRWVLTGKANYANTATSEDVEVAPFSEVANQELTTSVGLGRNLPTGGNITFELGVKQNIREIAIPGDLLAQVKRDPVNAAQQGVDEVQLLDEPFPINQAYAVAKFTQPLLRGGPSVATIPHQKADLAHAEATVRTQMAAEKLIREIVVQYWELAFAAYEVDIRSESLALARKQDQVTREEIRARTKAMNELNAVTYEIMSRSEQLLAAKTEYERRSLELRNKSGLGLERREVVMRPSVAFEIGKDEWDIEETRERAHKQNRNLAAIALQRRAALLDVKVAENNKLPSLDFTASAGIVGSGTNVGQAMDNAGGADGYQVSVGLTMSIDVGSGAARGASTAAQARRAKVEIDRLEQERLLDTDVARAVKAVTSARARVGLADKAIEVAEENIRAERANWAANTPGATNYSVVNRQNDLIQAKLRRGKAIMEYHVAVAELQALSGQLLEQYEVRVRARPDR
ncbi:MAG: TolC family protein [Deltaproteobacteria bacterium]|nr:TolC family protein [Deltaproteobacteria bacterium]